MYGERLVDRVDFEELALKGVDPSMGPKLSNPRSPTEEQKKAAFVCVTARRIKLSGLNTRPEQDPTCPSQICWHLAISSPRNNPFKAITAAPQGLLYVDAFGTADCTVYANPYVSTRTLITLPII
jgi:hypothetical protein